MQKYWDAFLENSQYMVTKYLDNTWLAHIRLLQCLYNEAKKDVNFDDKYISVDV